jgi:hypothetical protein
VSSEERLNETDNEHESGYNRSLRLMVEAHIPSGYPPEDVPHPDGCEAVLPTVF